MVPVCAPGLVTVTVLPVPELMVQLNETDPDAPVESVAVTVTLEDPDAVGVPEIKPEAEIDRPAGNPLAVKPSVCPDAESVACTCRLLIGVPAVPLWLPGLVTVTVLPAGRLLPPRPMLTLPSCRYERAGEPVTWANGREVVGLAGCSSR